MNVRTWHRMVLAGGLFFALTFLSWFMPEGSVKDAFIVFGTGFMMLTAAVGAVMGVLLILGRLRMGCPLCDSASKVSFGQGNVLCLECPECGDLHVMFGKIGPLKILDQDSADEGEDPSDWEENQKDVTGFKRLMTTPKRHPVACTLVYAPVVASIVAAGIIHEFSLFYVLIPGFWCYAIGAMLIEAIKRGRIEDNHGSAVRSRQPIRFWVKTSVWIAGYAFATCFPVVFAIQESRKDTSRLEKQVSPK
jgi:hypothetical protein